MSSVPGECWTQYLKDTGVSAVMNMPPTVLKLRDKNFKWSVAHAICGSNPLIVVCEKALKAIRKKGLLSLICAKDAQGDTPLHSTVRSKSEPEIITLLLNQAPTVEVKCYMLRTRNKSGETPLEIAFQMKQWQAVRPLLRECICACVLPKLTGIGSKVKSSKTLLHDAFQRADTQFFRILLEECKECGISDSELLRGLLVTDTKKRTPWYYLIDQDLSTVKEVLQTLEECSRIRLNDLYTHKTDETYLLHDAYRKNKKELIELLKSKGADQKKMDVRKLQPHQRSRNIACNQSNSLELLVTETHPKRKKTKGQKKTSANSEPGAKVQDKRDIQQEEHKSPLEEMGEDRRDGCNAEVVSPLSGCERETEPSESATGHEVKCEEQAVETVPSDTQDELADRQKQHEDQAEKMGVEMADDYNANKVQVISPLSRCDHQTEPNESSTGHEVKCEGQAVETVPSDVQIPSFIGSASVVAADSRRRESPEHSAETITECDAEPAVQAVQVEITTEEVVQTDSESFSSEDMIEDRFLLPSVAESRMGDGGPEMLRLETHPCPTSYRRIKDFKSFILAPLSWMLDVTKDRWQRDDSLKFQQ